MISLKQYLQENDYLFEVFIIGNKKPQDNDVVIAYNKWIWVFHEDDFSLYSKDIEEKIKTNSVFEELYELREYIDNYNSDIIIGEINKGYLLLRDEYRHSRLSSTLKKVLSSLKLKGIEVAFYDPQAEWEESSVIDKTEEFNKSMISQPFYHGTSYNFLDGIFRLGLRPVNLSNFNKIKHKDKVFITSNLEKAHFHALKSSNNWDSFPIILSIKLPNPDLLVLDYDIAVDIYGKNHPETIRLGYKDIYNYATKGNEWISKSEEIKEITKRIRNDKNDLNTKLGVFGYKGRIPATFIQEMIFDDESFKTFYITNEIMGDSSMDVNTRSFNNWESYTTQEFNNLKTKVEEQYEEEMEKYE